MFGRFIGWLLSVTAAFFIGTSMAGDPSEKTDSELQQKVQAHMDVIVDESAGIVDDVMEEARKDERVQKAEEFVNDVREIAQNTADDIEEHFGAEEAVTEGVEEAITE